MPTPNFLLTITVDGNIYTAIAQLSAGTTVASPTVASQSGKFTATADISTSGKWSLRLTEKSAPSSTAFRDFKVQVSAVGIPNPYSREIRFQASLGSTCTYGTRPGRNPS